MMEDKRIEWLCENVSSFKPAYEQAEAARKSSEENRKRMAALTNPTDDNRPTLNQLRLQDRGAA